MEKSKVNQYKSFLVAMLIANSYKIVSLNLKFKKMKLINSMRHFLERNGFGVFSRLADRLGVRAINVRLFFIYVTFFTVGLSFGLYLTMAFLLKLKDMVYTKRNSVFDL